MPLASLVEAPQLEVVDRVAPVSIYRPSLTTGIRPASYDSDGIRSFCTMFAAVEAPASPSR